MCLASKSHAHLSEKSERHLVSLDCFRIMEPGQHRTKFHWLTSFQIWYEICFKFKDIHQHMCFPLMLTYLWITNVAKPNIMLLNPAGWGTNYNQHEKNEPCKLWLFIYLVSLQQGLVDQCCIWKFRSRKRMLRLDTPAVGRVSLAHVRFIDVVVGTIRRSEAIFVSHVGRRRVRQVVPY